ncbi:hypothetical protein MBANPS3_004902 [Mucor bainieri]
MTTHHCSASQLLPVELLQNILTHVAKAEVHVRLNSRARAIAFVNDLEQYPFVGPRVDKVSITTEHCDLADLKNIASFCMNLKRLHFGRDVDMSKYLKMLYSNQVRLPHLQDIHIPKPSCLHHGIFALGIYSRFHKTLANLELSIDSTLKRLLRRNYGGLAKFVTNFKHLKTLQLNYARQEGMNSVDLQPLLSKHNGTLRKIEIDGIGELLIRRRRSPTSEIRQHEEYGLTKITIKSDTLDIQHLTLMINALKRSSNVQIIDKLVIFSSFSKQFGNTFVETILEELSDYYQDDQHVGGADIAKNSSPVSLIIEGANACRWTMTRTDSQPYQLNWRIED